MYLHRGAVLRNSGCVYAIVIATGVQTKIIKNQGTYKVKQSRLERMTNIFLLINLAFMLSMALSLTIANYYFNLRNYDAYFYIFEKSEFTEGELAFRAFFSFYLILNAYIPLDLIIVIEIAKLISTPFMENDVEMIQIYDIEAPGGRKIPVMQGFVAHTLNLHEELAEVEYVFADKTGTLTKNELVFRNLSFRLENGDILNFHQDNIEDLRTKKTVQQFFKCLNLCQDCMCIQD